MASLFDNREKLRQLSIVPYVVMLALIVPLTVLMTQKEQEVRTRASDIAAPTLIPTITPTATPVPRGE